ncbi:GSCOCG00009058001-RA-CDS [Cotesia congregata]|nr:GSCOCG00009058001-RA-CDS [Cotesia congregata]
MYISITNNRAKFLKAYFSIFIFVSKQNCFINNLLKLSVL